MTLISLKFFAFFLTVVIVYYILPGKLQWGWLLLSGMYFYYKGVSWQQMVIFLIYIGINWAAALFMQEDAPYRKVAFRTAVILDIAGLAIFKYMDFFVQIIKSFVCLFNPSFTSDKLDLLVYYSGKYAPARISYFALIIMGYLIDVYWGKVSVQKNPGKVLLFASYFPQMTSGPIVQYEMMQEELWGEKHHFDYDNFMKGLERIIWGIFKKMVISERCSMVVNTIYDNYRIYAGFYIPFGAAMFALQLYTDFSGLMDIVLGVSQCLGIKLPENFDTPFYSTNLSEFWRRWHITLGAFLRDYILYPIERSKPWRKLRKFCKNKFGKGYERKFNLPLYLALFISWFLIGLWHGGGWNYIFGVGLYMWAVIVLGEILSPVFAWLTKVLRINTECFSWKLFQRIRTFIFFVFGLSFFRAESLKDGFLMWKSAFSLCNPWIFFDHSLYKLGLSKDEWLILLLGLIILIVVSILHQSEDVREKLHKQNFVFRLLLFAVLFVMIINWGCYGADFVAEDFIYGRF